jgi:hypothetical protein
MPKRLCVLGVIVLLAACGNSPVKDVEFARAQRGELKWTEYYRSSFSKLAEASNRMNGKSFELEYLNKMIGYAQEYENGTITIAEFEEKRRLAQIARAKAKEESMNVHRRVTGEHVDLQTTY